MIIITELPCARHSAKRSSSPFITFIILCPADSRCMPRAILRSMGFLFTSASLSLAALHGMWKCRVLIARPLGGSRHCTVLIVDFSSSIRTAEL